MIEPGTARIPLRVDEHEFRTAGGGLAIPESACFLDPMRVNLGNIYQMPQIPRQELLSPLVVFHFPLCDHRRCKHRQQEWKQKEPRPDLANVSPLEQTCPSLKRLCGIVALPQRRLG